MNFNLNKNFIANNFRDLGIFNLKISASAQFNEDELKNIIQNYPNQKITFIDLRLEYHGFIDGEPINLRNYYSQTLPFDQSQEKQVLLDVVKKKFSLIENSDNKSVLTKSNISYEVLTEEEIVKKYHCNYQRFPLKDHHFPDHNQFEDFVQFIKNIEKDSNHRIHVHCAAGYGRTAIFLAIYDILINHQNSSINEIFTRQANLGGANLANIEYEDEWSFEQKQNIQILLQFYEQLNQSKL